MALRSLGQSHPRSVSLRKILFGCFVLVSIVPVSFLGLWVQRTAFESALAAVSDKHLLLAKNLSGALSRYAVDLQAVFTEKSEAPNSIISGDAHVLLAAFNIRMVACLGPSQMGEWERFALEQPSLSDPARNAPALEYKMGTPGTLPQGGLAVLAAAIARAQASPQTTIFSPLRLTDQSQPMFYLLRVNSRGTLVVAAVSTEYFDRLRSRVQFGEQGHAAIVDQTGQAIAHPLRDWQQSAKDMSALPPVQRMLRGETGVTQFYTPALGADMIAGYAVVPETGWGVMIPQPLAELRTDTRHTQQAALLVSLTGLLFAGGLSWQLARQLTAPLAALIQASHQLSQGQAAAPLALPGWLVPRELTQLVAAFNQMTLEVSQSRLHLQDKVAEQTQELRAEVEERRRLEDKLRQLANHDELTGLPNRRYLVKQLNQILTDPDSAPGPTLLLFIDLDGFKAVNDSFGHAVGDQLLIAVSRRIRELLRAMDQLYRLGGDEFVIILHPKAQGDGLPSHLGPLANRNAIALGELLIVAVQQPFWLEGQAIEIGCSIGIREIDPQGEQVTVDGILADADAAMYQAKAQRNCAVLFEPVPVT